MNAAFEIQEGERARLSGALNFATVRTLLAEGQSAINGGRAAIIDLSAVSQSDSAGLALLIEYLSIAKEAKRALHYENIPAQIQELARLSEVEALLNTGTQ
jgi:phospholipid transport system transporter-binding protein